MTFRLSRRGFTLGASATALAACNPSGGVRGGENFINVYTARHYEADRALYSGFEEATGIAVRALTGSAEQLLERLRAEGDATAADVFVSADAGNLWRVKDAGLFQNVATPALEQGVPAHLRDPEGAFWGFAKRARVIIYNKANVQPDEVATYDTLATPRFRNQIVMRSSTNVYQLSTLAARIERLGAENARAWAAGVRANFVRDPQGADTDQIKAVGAGEAQATLCNHYYYFRMTQSDDPADRQTIANTGLVFPDQAGAGTHVNISGGGVTAHAQRRDNAVRFLEYLVSDEAQTTLAPLNSEFPIRPTIAPAPALAALGDFKEENIPLDALGRHQAEAARIFEEVGWR
ncbi:extracellular solute-binding protein [Terricaulis silvestris]|uniref:Iron uptake protein A1 n=1 Tax=Terricaulis silvestris TaxID=2686094 RepID=A0A6I6MN18_9CAUL|nr:extracellular solute-binding protein [Terricaulis silvestris]QGZ94686.1 Iron uptake protein A1 precursor [Terricaulis silvestris]